MRCFVAVPLPEPVRVDLMGLQGELCRRGVLARWVAPDRMHLTLEFLGEVPPERFEEVKRALGVPLEPDDPSPRLTVSGVGVFPRTERARVVWAGLDGDLVALARLALEVATRLEPLGFPCEERLFRPHLTLGRIRDSRGARGHRTDFEALARHRGPEFTVDVVHLMESILKPRGPTYVVHLVSSVGTSGKKGVESRRRSR